MVDKQRVESRRSSSVMVIPQPSAFYSLVKGMTGSVRAADDHSLSLGERSRCVRSSFNRSKDVKHPTAQHSQKGLISREGGAWLSKMSFLEMIRHDETCHRESSCRYRTMEGFI